MPGNDEDLIARVLDVVKPYTMVAGVPLAFTIASALDAVDRNLPGDIVECGTWKGGCSFAMLLAQRVKYGRVMKPVWMFDSFEGLPPADHRDGPMALTWQADTASPNYIDNCKAPLEGVRDAIRLFGFSEDECRLAPGWFSDAIPPAKEELTRRGIALLRVDCDWYEPVRFCLDELTPLVAEEARVILDDYFAWDGCARAAHDFLSAGQHAYRLRSIEGYGAAWFEKRAARTGPL